MFGVKGLGFVGLGFNGFSSVRVVVHGLVYREAKPQPNGLLSFRHDFYIFGSSLLRAIGDLRGFTFNPEGPTFFNVKGNAFVLAWGAVRV